MNVTRSCPTCGYTRTYPTPRVADAHHRRHSCTRHQQQAAATARRAARASGRPTRDCPHPGAPHPHGSRVAYVRDRCRCAGCTAANTAAARSAARQRAFGRWNPYVDAGAVRDHIQMLRGTGIGLDRIAQLAGTSVSHIRKLADPGTGKRPPVRRVRPDTATRILAVAPVDANRAARSQVDATGTRRRLQALIALGWTLPQLAAELGRNTGNLKRSMTGQQVTARTAGQVNRLYQRLWQTVPPKTTPGQRRAADTARAHARARGWPPPLAWDDIDTDPHPQPDSWPQPAGPDDVDEIAVERAVAGDGIRLADLTGAEQAEAVRRLTERGKSIRDIAEQLGTTKRTVSRRRGVAASAA